jgi:hypothetical protein
MEPRPFKPGKVVDEDDGGGGGDSILPAIALVGGSDIPLGPPPPPPLPPTDDDDDPDGECLGRFNGGGSTGAPAPPPGVRSHISSGDPSPPGVAVRPGPESKPKEESSRSTPVALFGGGELLYRCNCGLAESDVRVLGCEWGRPEPGGGGGMPPVVEVCIDWKEGRVVVPEDGGGPLSAGSVVGGGGGWDDGGPERIDSG